MIRTSLAIAGLFATLLTVACGDGAGPKPSGLRACSYRVQFDLPTNLTTPGGLIGHHDFTFRVVEPTTAATSFTLVSSTNGTTTNYLDPATTAIIASASQWRVQWKVQSGNTIAVRVTMLDDGHGGFTLPFGCNGVRNETETFSGTNCSVVRVQ